MQFSRRQFIALLGSIPLIGAAYIRLLEPDWYEITKKVVHIGRFETPLRILHLSDFHASKSVSLSSIETAIDLALQQDADIAVLTGDYITDTLTDETEYRRILTKLSAAMPTYACIGNHDGGKWAGTTYGYKKFSKVQDLLESSGITFLFNQARQVQLKQHTFTIVGLGDYWSNDTMPQQVLHHTRDSDETIIVLSHNPDSKELLKPYDWDLLCCGHTHGGQLIIPLLGLRPFLPVRDKSFPEGLLTWSKRHIHITRGIGNLHGLRFNCRPEISVLDVS